MKDKLFEALCNPSDKIFKKALDQHINEIRLMMNENRDKPLPQLAPGIYWVDFEDKFYADKIYSLPKIEV